MDAIILAGGFGTRLKGVVDDIPKPMADINGFPLLKYLLDYLIEFNVKKVVLAVGYKYTVIVDYFKNKYKTMDIVYSIEDEPLGTGGAIKKAFSYINSKDAIVLNGDSFFNININELIKFHNGKNTKITLSSKKMYNFDRYGVIEVDANNEVIKFIEKKPVLEGLINCGMYIINKQIFDKCENKRFSFEKDILEKEKGIYAYITDDYFIDIGIPDDYLLAKEVLPKQFANIKK